jgi:hypothetical protein
MSNRVRCACRRCMIRGLMGPAVIITVGVLFLLNEMSGGRFSFGNTYPMILIVIGVISLAAAAASSEGHISEPVPPQTPMVPPTVPPPPQNQIPGPSQGQ